jgi:Tfp pilus assembly protein PilO
MDNLKNNILKQLHLLLLIYFGYGFYVTFDEHETVMAQLNSKQNSIKSKIKKEKKKLKKLNKFRESLKQTKERVEGVAEQINKVQKQLPTNVNDTEVLEFLTSEARALNIRNPNMSPLKEDANGFYFTKNYEVKGSGTYLQFLILLEKISSSERLFNVSELLFEKDLNGQKGRFRTATMLAKLQSYRYNESHKEQSGIKEIEKQFNTKKKSKRNKRKKRKNKK